MSFKLHYTDYGFGTPLILLHGNGDNSGYFKNQIEHFSRLYRVIAVDTRGHGKSPRGAAPFTLEQFAEDLYRLLNDLKIEKANILGFSDGGNIALIFALRHPDYVNRLILNGANLFPSGLKAAFSAHTKILFYLYSVFAKSNRNAARRCELLRLMAKEPDILPEELAGLNIPTLVIAGTKDLIKEKHTRLIADSLPDARLCFLNGGHSIAKTQSVEFNQTVEKFLEE